MQRKCRTNAVKCQNKNKLSHLYSPSASLVNAILARPSTFILCVLLLPSNMKT